MNDILSALLLLGVPGLPLLLAFPALRPCRAWSCHIAILPAIFVLLVPGVHSFEFPLLLFGSGLSSDGTSRWLLATLVILWVTAATLLQKNARQDADNYHGTFFLLTMAGNLGAVLATDLVGFFAFSTLMGYGFYGLLVTGSDAVAQRAGRVYLVLLVLADIALFEALLIVAASSNDLSFVAAQQAIAQSPSQGLYLSMVILGFALKAGIWPLTFWLPLAFRSISLPVALLLGGAPIAIALLGLLRWLPLGVVTLPTQGLILQSIGLVAMLYAIVVALKNSRLKIVPAYATIFATGLFFITIGVALVDPAIWHGYGSLAYLFIVFLVSGLAILNSIIARLASTPHYPASSATHEDNDNNNELLWFERYSSMALVWAGKTAYETLPGWRNTWLAKASHLWSLIDSCLYVFDSSEHRLQSWGFAITLFLVLSIIVVLIGISF